MPDSITPETIGLAEELAAPYDTPFETSIAVRDYLRDNITYNDQIAAPPEGVEPVHHTLFVTQEGYCNYYASAMSMMLRSQGIPSRVVSGYAQGEYDEDSKSYRVRASNAHTWVEVYFPEYGWIQFEPTASIPMVDRPETPGGGDAFASSSLPPQLDEEDPFLRDNMLGLNDQSLEDQLGGADGANTGFWGSYPIWQALGATLIVLLAATVIIVANVLNTRVEGDVDRSYQRLGSWARWLGIFYKPTDTPHERADMMAAVVPEGHVPIRNLTHEYARKQFSAEHTSDDAFDPQKEWYQLRPLLIRQSILKRLRHWQQRLRK